MTRRSARKQWRLVLPGFLDTGVVHQLSVDYEFMEMLRLLEDLRSIAHFRRQRHVFARRSSLHGGRAPHL